MASLSRCSSWRDARACGGKRPVLTRHWPRAPRHFPNSSQPRGVGSQVLAAEPDDPDDQPEDQRGQGGECGGHEPHRVLDLPGLLLRCRPCSRGSSSASRSSMTGFSTSSRRWATSWRFVEHDLLGPVVQVGAALDLVDLLVEGLLGLVELVLGRVLGRLGLLLELFDEFLAWSSSSMSVRCLGRFFRKADERLVAGQHVDAIEHEGDVVEIEVLDLLPPQSRRTAREIRSRSAMAITLILARAASSPSCFSSFLVSASLFGRLGLGRRRSGDAGRPACSSSDGMWRRRGLMPEIPMKLCWTARSRRACRPRRLVRSSGMNSGPSRPLGAEQAGEDRDDLLQPRAGDLLGIERVACAAPLADEDDLRRELGKLGMRIVRVPDDLGRSASRARSGRARAAGCPWAREDARRRTGRPAASWEPRARADGLSTGQRIEEEQCRPALLHVVGQVVDLPLGQRGRLGDQQDVEIGGDRRVGRDRADVVLLLELGDDRPFRVWPKLRVSNPPIILASVLRMPTFLRPLRETTRIDRVSSYSTGRPRSKNGMTTSSRPEVNATPRKISADICLAWSSAVKTRRGSMPNRFSASRASSE